MVKRNKELELEALIALEKQQNEFTFNESMNTDIQREKRRLELEKDKAEFDHAIEISKAAEQERKKLLEKEEEDLKRALELSLKETNQKTGETSNDLVKYPPLESIEVKEETNHKIEITNANRLANVKVSEEKFSNPLENQKLEEVKTDSNQKAGENTFFERHLPTFEEKKFELGPLKKASELPPVKLAKRIEPDLEDMLKSREKANFDLENFRQEELQRIQKKENEGESMLERKRRLEAQRQMILKKKQAEREAELQKYKNNSIEEKPKIESVSFIKQETFCSIF